MGIFSGLTYLIKALMMLLTHPKLIMLSLIPSLVTVVVSFANIYLCSVYGEQLLQYVWTSYDPSSWSSTFAYFTLVGVGSFLGFLITPWLVMIFGFPLCEPLAAHADHLLGGEEVEVGFLSGVVSGLGVSILIALLGLSGAIILFILSFIPGLVLFTTPFSFFVWTPFLLCFDLCETSFTRRDLSFSARFKKLRSHLLSTISVGFIAFILISIPIVNLIGLPIAVLMGTQYVAHFDRT